MEAVTLDLMYHIPSDESITECEITKDLVEEKLSIEEQKLKTIEEKIEDMLDTEILKNTCGCASRDGHSSGNDCAF